MKSRVGVPDPEFRQGVDLGREARRGRLRLYPVTVAYLGLAAALLAAGVSEDPLRAIGCAGCGLLLWTLVEYLVHRHVLHAVFPDSPGALGHFLHRRFDDLHWRHHLRPWDGAHINGTLRDTGLFVGLFLALSLLEPMPTAPALLAGFLAGYVVEEWVHHSVHFYRFRYRYFRYIQRHHLYHHSPRGREVAFGLSSGLWDFVVGTRVPVLDRARLFGRGIDRDPRPPHAPVRDRAGIVAKGDKAWPGLG